MTARPMTITTPSAADKPLSVVLAAGGTGGHVFPAEALADELLQRDAKLTLITDRRGAAYGGTLGRINTLHIRASGVAGRGIVKRLAAGVSLVLGTLQAIFILRKIKPDAVVGFGGYASVPTMLAALWLKLPTIVHEQNAVPGRANRLLAARVSQFATSFDADRVSIKARKVHTGMPVRPAVAALAEQSYLRPGEDDPLFLLVTGGSQGAQVFSSLVPDAIARLPEALRQRLHITQQCRSEDLDAARAQYADMGVHAHLQSFFDDMPVHLTKAHLVICRAGASTIAELEITGRPAILVPYPYAIDDHQTANARALSEAGGGWLMPQEHLNADGLASRLTDLLTNPDVLVRAARCARSCAVPDAAIRLADLVSDLVTRPRGSSDLPAFRQQHSRSEPPAGSSSSAIVEVSPSASLFAQETAR